MKVFISGMSNIETTVSIGQFPIDYAPSRFNFFGNYSNVSGVGMNLALALNALGAEVSFFTQTGDDALALLIEDCLVKAGISQQYLSKSLKETMQSVILYDDQGSRSMFTDLKDWQDTCIDVAGAASALEAAELAFLTNGNVSRPLLHIAKRAQVPIVTDVHNLANVHDEYNREFLSHANVILISNESFIGREREFVAELAAHYSMDIIVCGMGHHGALLWQSATGQFDFVPAVTPRPVVNTVGAGDSLCASFSYLWAMGLDPLSALKKAVYFAGWKIGERGAGSGFLNLADLHNLN